MGQETVAIGTGRETFLARRAVHSEFRELRIAKGVMKAGIVGEVGKTKSVRSRGAEGLYLRIALS